MICSSKEELDTSVKYRQLCTSHCNLSLFNLPHSNAIYSWIQILVIQKQYSFILRIIFDIPNTHISTDFQTAIISQYEDNYLFKATYPEMTVILHKQIYTQTIIIKYDSSFSIMHHLIDSDSNQDMPSPSKFILELEQPSSYDQFQIQLDSSMAVNAHRAKQSVDQPTLHSDKEGKRKMASLKSRQKKKIYLDSLEREVEALSKEIHNTENEISKVKDKILDAARISSNNLNQHGPIFAELELAYKEEDIDLDKINLLLDLIQNRIGANAKERQANIDYNFKQIVNFMFPAMHRYLMRSALYALDIFQQHSTEERLSRSSEEWTQQFFSRIQLSQNQMDKMNNKRQELINKRSEAKTHIHRLIKIKGELKQQQERFELAISDIRQGMGPIQSALITVFGQKNKLRRQFSTFTTDFQELEPAPTKKIKLQG